MASVFIEGTLHKVHKPRFKGETCDNCGKRIGAVGWAISQVKVNKERTYIPMKRRGNYCYECTNNHWATALRLFKESIGAYNE